MLVGAALLILGAVLHFVPGLLGWFGRLPGDIRIETERGTLFFPLASMILLSIVISVLLNLFRR